MDYGTDFQAAGDEIRRILLSLHAPGHTKADEHIGWNSYSTDDLRKKALDAAGICWKAPGEMAPACGCPHPPKP